MGGRWILLCQTKNGACMKEHVQARITLSQMAPSSGLRGHSSDIEIRTCPKRWKTQPCGSKGSAGQGQCFCPLVMYICWQRGAVFIHRPSEYPSIGQTLEISCIVSFQRQTPLL